MSQLLSQIELAELTGSKSVNKQKTVLSGHGIGFIVRYDGKISTTWDAVHSVLRPAKIESEPEGPNLDFLRPCKSD